MSLIDTKKGRQVKKWVRHVSNSGVAYVDREAKKLELSANEAAKIEVVKNKHAEGRTRTGTDVKPLRDGVSELRISGNRRKFRLYFAELDDECVLLELHLQAKKKNLDKDAIDLAVQRLNDYRRSR